MNHPGQTLKPDLDEVRVLQDLEVMRDHDDFRFENVADCPFAGAQNIGDAKSQGITERFETLRANV